MASRYVLLLFIWTAEMRSVHEHQNQDAECCKSGTRAGQNHVEFSKGIGPNEVLLGSYSGSETC